MMRWASEREQREDQMVAAYAGLAVMIHLLEAGFPSPIPGIKPGLANVITLIVLARHGWRLAAWVVVLRVMVGALLLGSLFTPTFFLSLGGAISSLACLGLLTLIDPQQRLFTPLGLGMFAACGHICGQFFLAYTLFVPHSGLLGLLPVLCTAGLGFGLVTGGIAKAVLARMSARDA